MIALGFIMTFLLFLLPPSFGAFGVALVTIVVAIVVAAAAMSQPISNAVAKVGPECPLVFGRESLVIEYYEVIQGFDYDPSKPTLSIGEGTVQKARSYPVYSVTLSPPYADAYDDGSGTNNCAMRNPAIGQRR